MKKCINRACNAELEDYQKRCPDCGRLQKQEDLLYKTEEPTITTQPIAYHRHGFVTFWLWVLIVGNFILAIISFFPKIMWGEDVSNVFVAYSVIIGINDLCVVIGAFNLLLRKKSGFYLIGGSAILGGILSIIMTHSFPSPLIGLVTLWAVLQIKKNGISYWEVLE